MSTTPYALTEELMDKAGGRYKLVVLAFRRAAELNAGAAKLVKSDSKKVTTIALEEITQGKIFVKPADSKEAKKDEKKKA